MRKIWTILLLALMLWGCAREEAVSVVFEDAATFPVETVSEFPLLDMSRTSDVKSGTQTELYTDQGRFYCRQTDPENNGDYLLMFGDFASGESYPVCPKSNCRHDGQDCGAWFSFGTGSPGNLHSDGEFLYFYLTGDQTLYRQNLDGSGRKALCQIPSPGMDILYEGRTAYALSYETEIGEDQQAVSFRRLVRIDLFSGEKVTLPFSFDGDMVNVSLLGKYGGELLMKYSWSTDTLTPFLDPESTWSTFFLFDPESGTVTRLADYRFTYIAAAKCPGYLICGIFDEDTRRTAAYGGEEIDVFSGELRIFDLEDRVCYRLESDYLTWRFSIRDGRLFYYEADSGGLVPLIRDLATGEVIPWRMMDDRRDWSFWEDAELDGYFLIYVDDALYRITKEDFYAGEMDLIPVP